MTRGERVIAFIEKFCLVPEGPLVGKPITLGDFQKKFILDVYDNPHKTRVAILSMARKNGKTGLIACLCLAHIVGPESSLNSQISSGAMSKENAGLVFKAMSKMINLNPELQKLTRVVPSKKQIFGLPMNVEYMALAKDGKTNMGGSPLLLILDETGQVVGPSDDFIDAVVTSQGAHDEPLRIVISTQAASDNDLLSIWIDDALTGEDPQKICHLYEADESLDLLDEKGWYQSNPALGIFRNYEDMKNMANDAHRMKSFENSFRNLYLNQRVSKHNPFVAKSTWDSCIVDRKPPISECEEVYGGLDLSKRTDLTAFVCVGLYKGLWYVYPQLWTPSDGLHERAKRDRSPYDVWVNQGHLKTTPGATVDYEFVATEMGFVNDEANLVAVAYDRYRMDVMKKELERLDINLPLVDWGQGFKDMSPALDAVESLVLNGKMKHDNNPVMNMCAGSAIVTVNPAGDRKLDKAKTSKRIDGFQALAMACGIAERKHEEKMDIDAFINDPIIV